MFVASARRSAARLRLGRRCRRAVLVGARDVVTLCRRASSTCVLLAENRLSLAGREQVTPLRLGFLVQFLLFVGVGARVRRGTPAGARADAAQALVSSAGLHLAHRRGVHGDRGSGRPAARAAAAAVASRWRGWLAMFRPGRRTRRRCTCCVQMVLLMAAASPRSAHADVGCAGRWQSAGTSASSPAFPRSSACCCQVRAPPRISALLILGGDTALLSGAARAAPGRARHYVVAQPDCSS